MDSARREKVAEYFSKIVFLSDKILIKSAAPTEFAMTIGAAIALTSA